METYFFEIMIYNIKIWIFVLLSHGPRIVMGCVDENFLSRPKSIASWGYI